MATLRKVVFRNEEIYHVFNRGLDRRDVFTDKSDFERATRLIKFYRHLEIPARFSKVYQLPTKIRDGILESLYRSDQLVQIISYCLMPNHFHFLLKQNTEKGISTLIANFTNAYTRYFNTKYERSGPLLGGTFKAVHIESEEQLLHVVRYIHLNPVVSCVIQDNRLKDYPWSSHQEYLSLSTSGIAQKDFVLQMFKSVEDYQSFVADQIEYAKMLETIKHLALE